MDEPTRLQSRFRGQQQDRSLIHASLPQPPSSPGDANDTQSSDSPAAAATEDKRTRPNHTFVVCADPQLGMTSQCQEWETELAYSRKAVQLINALEPRPLFCMVCGDIADMEYTFFEGSSSKFFTTRQQCDQIQNQQYRDFQAVYDQLHPEIPLVCLCGNHDIGNRPTPASISKFANFFGDDYLAFWANGTYNIVLNTSLISDPSAEGAQELYDHQLAWLKERLEYAKGKQASNIFVFGHHPWFLYRDDEVSDELTGESPIPGEWGPRDGGGIPDSYFHIPIQHREIFLDLFRHYGVTACFSGHFHQNFVSKSSWGMEMIITGSLSMVLESTGKPKTFAEVNTRGVRLVEVEPPNGDNVDHQQGKIKHRFLPLT
jgi:serine/threonine-protein phosphatase CPPED1